MSKNKFYITHLYPKTMSLYGDWGNILSIQKMLKEIGWEYVYQPVESVENLPEKNDLYIMGGGQDRDQEYVSVDLAKAKERIKNDIEEGVAALTICGGYQLFGKHFITGDDVKLNGIDVYPITTESPKRNVKSRCIGNIIIENSTLKEDESIKLIGFENHGGQTYFTSEGAVPLGKVLIGNGNNLKDKVEGCIYKNAIGTYFHSFLPKNPEVTYWLINKVAERKKKLDEIGYGLFYAVKEAKIKTEIALAAKNQLIEKFSK